MTSSKTPSNKSPVPCYVSGKGMYASDTTWSFKTTIIMMLEETGLGYDTRFNYYRRQFPDIDTAGLARMICDPMEYYDRDFPAWLSEHQGKMSEAEAATQFMLTLDNRFQAEAQCAIYCFDEAGFGSGVNVMRFLTSGKPLLGFYNPDKLKHPLNISNIMQLELLFPELATLDPCREAELMPQSAKEWLCHQFPAD